MRHHFQHNIASGNLLSNEMEADINMLRPRVRCSALRRDVDRRLVILIDRHWKHTIVA
jgi:predicted secreted Zn-dependent protease